MRDILRLKTFMERPNSVLNRKFRYQFLATLTINIIAISHGIGLGWLSPTLHKLQSADSPLQFPIDITQASWIGSLLGLGSFTGNLTFGFLIDLIGRKLCIYFVAIPHMLLWILIYSAQSVEYLYLARFLGGFTGGSCYVVLPIFVSEISDASIRGTLSVMLMLSVNLGILFGYILATHLSYHLLPTIVFLLPIIYLIGSLFFPETPQHLLRKGNYSAAENSFKFYKNCMISFEDLQKCHREFEELKTIIAKGQDDGHLTYRDFVTKPALKSFGLAAVVLIVNQFSGNFAFVNYMSHIFTEAGSTLDANTCTIIMGFVTIGGCYAATIFVDRYGRKILMLYSTSGVGIGLLLFGLFVFYSKITDLSQLLWVPLVLMAFVIFVVNMGIVALTFTILIEIFPVKIRSFGASTCMAILSLLVFLMLKIFPLYLYTFGLPITMWSCATVSIVSFVLLALFLPETKGKSMDED